jgi:hypothetical protein
MKPHEYDGRGYDPPYVTDSEWAEAMAEQLDKIIESSTTRLENQRRGGRAHPTNVAYSEGMLDGIKFTRELLAKKTKPQT